MFKFLLMVVLVWASIFAPITQIIPTTIDKTSHLTISPSENVDLKEMEQNMNCPETDQEGFKL